MLNKCGFTGRCGKDPEIRYTQGGVPVVNLSIACEEKRGKGEEAQTHTEWIRLVFWNRLAEVAGNYLHSGDKILVIGKMRTEEWDDDQGGKRSTTKIHVTYLEMLGGNSGRYSQDADDESPWA